MKINWRKTTERGRFLIIALIFIAIGWGGVRSASRQLADFCKVYNDARAIAEMAQFVPGPPSPDELPQNMASGSKPCSEQEGCFFNQVTTFVNADNSSQNPKYQQTPAWAVNQTAYYAFTENRLCSTPSQVSSALGQRFTLVGARPSGTS